MQCTAQTKRGAPCPRKALVGKSVCGNHDAETVRARTSAGGKARATRYTSALAELSTIPLETVADVRQLIATAIALVNSSKAENCTRARVLLAAAQAALDVIRTHDLEQELRELRELVEARLGGVKP